MIRKKRIGWFAIAFFGSMLLLTLAARPIHEASLARVRVIHPKKMMFDITDSSGEVMKGKHYALPAETVTDDFLFCIYTYEKNHEERVCVAKKAFQLGNEADGFYPILEDSYGGDPVVVETDRALCDGEEVIVEEEK